MANDLVTITAGTVDEITRMANAIAKSQLFGLKTPEQALALMLIAHAEGRHPAMAARDYHIINNQPSKKAESMLRDFLLAGGRVEWHSLTDTEAAATFSHPHGGTARIDWDIPRATKAGVMGNATWKKYPRAMLRSRVVSEGVRTIYPAATSGMYVPEEVQDFDPPEAKKPAKEKKPEAVDVEVKEVPLLDRAKTYAELLKGSNNQDEFEEEIKRHFHLMGELAKHEVKLHERMKEIIEEKRAQFAKEAEKKKPKAEKVETLAEALGDAIPEFQDAAE